MNRPLIAERFLQPEENLLMEIATLAKKTPNLIEQGTPEQIFEHPQNARTQDFLSKVL